MGGGARVCVLSVRVVFRVVRGKSKGIVYLCDSSSCNSKIRLDYCEAELMLYSMEMRS